MVNFIFFIFVTTMTKSHFVKLCLIILIESSIGELHCIDDVDINRCVESVKANPEFVVGTKLRLSEQIANGGQNEQEALR